MNSNVNQIFHTNTEMKIINQVNYSHISEGTVSFDGFLVYLSKF